MKAFLMTSPDEGTHLHIDNFTFKTWEQISPAIGCRTFDVVRLYENGDCAYIDDEGLYNAEFFWIHKNYPHPLANNALFCGTDEMGETVSFKTPLTALRAHIKPVSKHELYVYSRANPEDYRPYFFTEWELEADCDHDCDYRDIKQGQCECFNREMEIKEELSGC